VAAQITNISAAKKANRNVGKTDHGDVFNAEKFAKKFAGQLAYSHQKGVWMEFGNHAWRPDETGHVIQHAIDVTRDLLLDASQLTIEAAKTGNKATAEQAEELIRHARNSQNKPKIEAMISLAKTSRELAVKSTVFDANNYALGLKNGVIELDHNCFRDGEAGDYISKQADCEFDGDAECPTWLKFLQEVQPDPDVRAWLQRFVGYCLTGSISEQIFVVSHGLGGNGKSIFWDAIRKMLGDYATTVQFDTFTERPKDSLRNDLARLDGARLVLANEGQNGARLDEGIVKQITGGDEITARFLHKEFFSFKPRFKVSLITNHKPVISGNDNGIWRRVVLVPWPVQIPAEKRDRELDKKLEKEMSGILNWALEGLQKYNEVGLSPLPTALVLANADYRKDSDIIGLWLSDCAELNNSAKTPIRDVYESYKTWSLDNGHKPMASKSLGDRLKERGVTDCRIGSAGTRGWEGVRIMRHEQHG